VDDPTLHIHKIRKIPVFKHLDNMIALPSNQKNILAASDTYMHGLVGYLEQLPDCILIVDPVYLAAFSAFLQKRAIPALRLSTSSRPMNSSPARSRTCSKIYSVARATLNMADQNCLT